MGSDRSPFILFNAVLEAAKELDSTSSLVVIATHSVVRELQQNMSTSPQYARIEYHPVADAIAMGDEPLVAIYRKKQSSLVVGMRLLKKQKIDAFVSSGNTGALVAAASVHLAKLGQIKRPALLALLPTVKGYVAVLDVGGTVSCRPHHFVQFAQLGAAYQHCMGGIAVPKVGLLNIGVEPKKGTSVLQQVYQLLKEESQEQMQFLGNVEGRNLFQGEIDVLVTDGFTGNVLLKTSEGVSAFIFEYIQETLEGTASEKLQQQFKDLKGLFSYTEYPGALLCGVEGIVIKCHGSGSPKAMLSSIQGAVQLVQNQFVSKMKQALSLETL